MNKHQWVLYQFESAVHHFARFNRSMHRCQDNDDLDIIPLLKERREMQDALEITVVRLRCAIKDSGLFRYSDIPSGLLDLTAALLHSEITGSPTKVKRCTKIREDFYAANGTNRIFIDIIAPILVESFKFLWDHYGALARWESLTQDERDTLVQMQRNIRGK